ERRWQRDAGFAGTDAVVAHAYSAATGSGSEPREETLAEPPQNRLRKRIAATRTSTISGWPWSISMPNGTGVTALPSGSPEETKPNTLPIWPGGAASLTMTSRGVRLAPSARPERNVSAQMSTTGMPIQFTHRISNAELMVRQVMNGSTCFLNRSANQPPT